MRDPTGTEGATSVLNLTPGGYKYGTPEGEEDVGRMADGLQSGIEAAAITTAGGKLFGLVAPTLSRIPLVSRAITAIRNATVVQRSGFTVNQTKALANFFGKGADGAKAAIRATGKEGFSLPKGLTEKTLQTYRDVATKAIEAGKPAEVQKLRIEAIDKALKALKD